MKGRGGTGSQGMRSSGKSHIPCRRCGRSSFHIKRSICSSCGYGNSSKLRRFAWKNTRKRNSKLSK